MMFKNAPVTEPIPVPDTFVTGIADIEDLGGGILRFSLCVGHRSLLDNTLERQIVSRIVMHRDDVKKALLAVELALAGVEGAVHDTIVGRRN